jgi:hypothetical protein
VTYSLTTNRRLLCDAWLRIEDPKHWTRGASARYSDGHACRPEAPAATQFCANGIIDRLLHERSQRDLEPVYALRNATRLLYDQSDNVLLVGTDLPLTRVNDDLGHEAVQRVYALAVALLTETVEIA